MTKMAETATNLYRHYDVDGRLLYVGISLSAIQRLCAHQKSDWSKYIASVSVKTYATRASALLAERSAIKSEAPIFNAMHNGGRKPYAGKLPLAPPLPLPSSRTALTAQKSRLPLPLERSLFTHSEWARLSLAFDAASPSTKEAA